MSARSIFYKQRSANFYRTSVYVLSCSVTQLPLAIGESLIFGTLIYWLCGFVNAAGNYIIFMVLLTLTNTAFAAWFFLITAVSPDIHISKPVAMMSILPDYFIWFYWLNPISWCLRALAVNQYRSSTFDVCVYDGFNFCATFDLNAGEYFMSLFEISTDKFWIICGGIFMIVAYIVFMTLTSISKKLVENEDSYVALNSPKSVGLQAAQPADSTVLDINNKEKNFVPVTLAFQDLWYSVKSPSNPNESLDLLKGISGFAMPGSITALMGSSGAGKTTLMDVIAGRKTEGTIKGKILLNGYEATDLAIRRSTGYCEQMDIHSEASTFREALTFSSFLRQDSSVPHSRKIDSVNECLDLLDMHDIADHIIRGSSVEQMKRLTIGVELAAQPSVCSWMNLRVADSGRTIVCTIHQPSTEVFLVFDSLLLLKRGGETVFFGNLGTNCQHLIDYFSSIPGSPELLKGYNPATWMLECIGAGVGKNSSNDVDFVEYFNQSKEKQALVANMNVEGVTSPSSQTKELTFDRKRASSSMTQAKFLLIRFVRMYWRTPTYNITRMIIALMLGLLAGLVFVDANYTSYQELNSGVGMLYLMALFNGLVLFYRERASQTYNALWYFVGSTIAEIPYSFISGALFTAVFYPMVGFEGLGASILFWINLSILMLMMTYMGQLFVYVMPNLEVADVLGLLISSIYILFMGYNPPASEIPSGYRWLYDITPYTYSIGNLVALVFANCDDLPIWDETTQQYVGGGSALGCQIVTGTPLNIERTTVKEYVENVFNINHDNLWRNFGIVFAFIFVYRILGLLALRFVNHQKR
ncbi:putative pleiotropic drug resistance protein PDR/CDR [Plasmopara halstedii]